MRKVEREPENTKSAFEAYFCSIIYSATNFVNWYLQVLCALSIYVINDYSFRTKRDLHLIVFKF